MRIYECTGRKRNVKDAARFFKVLADEARLAMLWLLFNHEELCVCDIMAALGISQSKASRHLGTMRNAGLLTDRRDGLWTHYALSSAGDELVRGQLEALRAALSRRPDAAPMLARLHDRLEEKRRDLCCSAGAACAPLRGARPGRTRARGVGGRP
jgi:ArsR family transcriptional regulator